MKFLQIACLACLLCTGCLHSPKRVAAAVPLKLVLREATEFEPATAIIIGVSGEIATAGSFDIKCYSNGMVIEAKTPIVIQNELDDAQLPGEWLPAQHNFTAPPVGASEVEPPIAAPRESRDISIESAPDKARTARPGSMAATPGFWPVVAAVGTFSVGAGVLFYGNRKTSERSRTTAEPGENLRVERIHRPPPSRV